jgi:hypothetical protein
LARRHHIRRNRLRLLAAAILIPQPTVVGQHRHNNRRGNSGFLETQNCFCGEDERPLAVLDVGQDYFITHSGARQFEHFGGIRGKSGRR